MKDFFKKNIKIITLLFITCFIALSQYLPILINQEIIYPQGGDATSHLWMTKIITDTGSNAEILYPTSFHILLSALHFITGVTITNIFIYIVPFISCLVLLGLYLITRKFINEQAAILAVFIMAFISYHPQWYIGDATIVNVLAVFFFTPLILLYAYKYLKTGQIFNLIVCAIFFFNNGILHTVGFLYPVVILTISLILVTLLVKGRSIKKKALILLLVVFIIAMINPYQIVTSYVAPIFLKNINQVSSNLTNPDEIAISGVPIVGPKPFDGFLGHINKFIWLLFLFSLPVIYRFYKKPNKKIAFIILATAFAFLFIGARTTLGIETERFSRDFTLILIILASFFSYILINNKYKKILVSLFILITILVYMPKSIAKNLDYRPEFNFIDYQAISSINDEFKNSKNILLSPTLRGLSEIPGPFVYIFEEDNTKFIGTDCFDQNLHYPNRERSRQFYKENNIDFIYYRNQPLGWIPVECSFKFDTELEKSDFLEKIDTFKKNDIIIKIYQVDKNKL